jgi:PRTRC genetic system protein A
MGISGLVGAVVADGDALPPATALKEYVVAGNGVFIRAENARMEAMIPIASAQIGGLSHVFPYARLRDARVPAAFLWSVLKSARKQMQNEVLYQFMEDGGIWRCIQPTQRVTAVSVEFYDQRDAAIDLHSHNSMGAFFSEQDDADEGGLRFYGVIGRLDVDRPEMALRVGVYGEFWPVPISRAFTDTGPFVDLYGREGCDAQGE